MISRANITLGILAGGQATRLGGVDKAWLQRDGVPQVLRWQRRFADEVATTLVSANRDLKRYAAHGLATVVDHHHALGPITGLDALACAARTSWLLTLPVDLVDTNECLLATLCAAAQANGAFAQDDDGAQPLVALWNVTALRPAVAQVIATGDTAVHALQTGLGMTCVRFAGVRFGNLNTPAQLREVGMQVRP